MSNEDQEARLDWALAEIERVHGGVISRPVPPGSRGRNRLAWALDGHPRVSCWEESPSSLSVETLSGKAEQFGHPSSRPRFAAALIWLAETEPKVEQPKGPTVEDLAAVCGDFSIAYGGAEYEVHAYGTDFESVSTSPTLSEAIQKALDDIAARAAVEEVSEGPKLPDGWSRVPNNYGITVANERHRMRCRIDIAGISVHPDGGPQPAIRYCVPPDVARYLLFVHGEGS